MWNPRAVDARRRPADFSPRAGRNPGGLQVSTLARSGLTRLEVSIACGLVVLFIVLVLAAVERARGVAHQSRNRNNMRQIGTALSNYYGTHGSFPK